MLCALSGESPQDPVISTKSGNVFERRLIEKYIQENGKDPVTNEELTIDDIISLKTSHVPRPRPPTFTSIPSLLSAFQNEWDAFALEAFQLRKELGQTRQELSTALYQHDAAVRVIARLTKERDEARDALSKVTVSSGSAPQQNGDAMQIDSGLPQDLQEKMDQVQATLTKGRRKRPVPASWATIDQIQTYTTAQQSEPTYPGSKFLALNKSQEVALVGGADGLGGIFSIAENKLVQPIVVGDGAITDGLFYEAQPVFATSTGAVKVFGQDSKPSAVFTKHAGAATALALHPTGDILASVGVDKSVVVYDLVKSDAVAQIYTEFDLSTVAYHPDGHLLAVGSPGQISLYHAKTLEFAASYNIPSQTPITSLVFSENGIWFAASTGNSVHIFDLRKEGEILKTFESSAEINAIAFDYTGQYLASAGKGGVEVRAYKKKEKVWEEPLQVGVPGEAVQWADEAGKLVLVGSEGVITVLSAKA